MPDSWFSWGQVALAGLGFDIAGATMLGWSVFTRRAQAHFDLALELTHGRHRGDVIDLGKGFARQTVEARLGIGFLLVGFLLQALSYFEGAGGLDGWRAIALGIAALVAPCLLAWGVYAKYVDTATEREWTKAEEEHKRLVGEREDARLTRGRGR